MSESVSLPALGESVTEGTVTRWLKNIGDRVEVDEPLLEVSTDKVDTEIPSPIAGVLEEILVQEDETIEVGAELAKIGDGSGAGQPSEEPAPAADDSADEQQESEEEPTPSNEQAEAEAAEEAPASAESAPAEESADEQAADEESADEESADEESDAAQAEEEPQEQPAARRAAAPAPEQKQAPVDVSGNAGYVTPLVRRLAHQHGVDIATVSGTGVGGRIRKEDVLAAAKPSSAAPSSRPSLEVSELRGTTQTMSRLRKVAAEQAVSSMQSTAQVTTVIEVDVTKVAALLDRSGATFQQKTGQELTYLPFFAKAATEALQAYPVINAVVDGEQIVYPEHENLSIAVDTERGLLSPVVKDAASLDIAGLSQAFADLAERTRSNGLKPDELSGGTFTLANSGSRGALLDTPVVFLPQSAALSTGAVTRRPVVVEADGADAVAVRSMVYLSLSYDQRIIDNTEASRFLVAVKDRLEQGGFEDALGI